MSTSASPLAIDVPADTANAHLQESINFHRAIGAYWQGYSERCQCYIGKLQINFNCVIIASIHGMNSSRLLKSESSTKTRSISKKKLRSVLKNAIKVLKTAAIHSCWNFLNKVRYNQSVFDALFTSFTHYVSKFVPPSHGILIPQVHLLEAEELSSNCKHSKAQASYAAAINSLTRLDSFMSKVLHVSLLAITTKWYQTLVVHGASSIRPSGAIQSGAVK